MARVISGPQLTGRAVSRHNGGALAGATITVSSTVYTDVELTAGTTTLTTDGSGAFRCYAKPGVYTFTCSDPQAAAIEAVEVLSPDEGTTPGTAVDLTGYLTSAAANAAYVPLAGAATVAADLDFTGDLDFTAATLLGIAAGGGLTYNALAAGTGITGDGTTDDAAAIGTWLATIPAGAQAFFPAATYKVGAAITLPAQQVYVMGEGEGTVWNVTADGIIALTLTGSNNRSSFARIKIQLATTAPTSMALKLDAVFNLDFDRVTVIGSKTSQASTYDGQIGVFSTNNAGDTRFRACTITQCGIGVTQDCEETTYLSCHINQNKVNLLTFGAGAGAKVIGGIAKGSSNTGGASVSDYGFLFAGLGHHQMSGGWCEAVNTACMQVGQNATASTTVAAGSNGATLATSRTLTVASTTGFPTSGTATVVTSTGTKSFAYSNVDATHFYGVVSSGTGTLSTGAAVATTPVGPVMCSVPSAFFNGGATFGLDVQKGRINGMATVGAPGTFGTPVRLDGTNASGLLTLDIPSGTLPSVPNTFSCTFHVSSSPGSWASPVVITAQGSNRNLAFADANTIINSSGAITLTVPPNATTAFPIGTVIGMLAAGGQITVGGNGVSGVTVLTPTGNFTSRATNSTIFLTKVATDTWALSGDLT